MTKIKAPYNFVPLSNEVVFPKWEKAVNHDVPFADGETGTINVKIKTHSPIFVNNGLTKKEKESFYKKNNLSEEQIKAFDFFNREGKYYIPGSSLKGMLRSVIEVMSFSKMQKSNVNDDKYSVRDFQNKDIYPMLDLAKEVKAAWLREKDGKYFLQDCGAPGRIPHHWIDDAFGTKFRSFYKKDGKFNGNKEEHKSAKFKYEQFGANNRTTGFVSAKYGKDNAVDVRKFFKVDPSSDKKGTLVFAGQPGPRKDVPKGGKGKPSGKIHEFIFFETNKKEIEVNEDIIKNFFFAYFEHDKNRQSVDWKFWRNKLRKGEQIPVFFRYENERKQIVKDMGLSYLYKIIYNNSVLDSVPEQHKSKDKRDLAETIFGYIDNKQSLKGRVHIGHANAINEGVTLKTEKSILSGPKASYYPNYIRQNGKNGLSRKYNTFMDNTAVIAGWKRYPVHKNGVVSNPGSTDNKKVETSFVPLDAGVEFEFKIRVHNLRKAELGAIISALTFHNTKGTFHSIGMAKPLGYGKSSLEIISIDGFTSDDVIYYMKEYEAYMNYALGYTEPSWHSLPQIIELLTMVSEHNNSGKSELSYMKMDTKGGNDFVEAKKSKEYLDSYSNLVGGGKDVTSLITDVDVEKFTQSEKNIENSFQDIDLDKVIDGKKNKFINEFIEPVEKELESLLKNTELVLENINYSILEVNSRIKEEQDRPYTELIEKADTLYKQENWQKAMDKYIEASELKPNENYPKQQKNKCIKKIKGSNISLDGIKGLNDFKQGKKIIETYYKSNDSVEITDETDIAFLNEFISSCISKSNKRWKKVGKQDWKLVEKWLGKETAQQWFNEIKKIN